MRANDVSELFSKSTRLLIFPFSACWRAFRLYREIAMTKLYSQNDLKESLNKRFADKKNERDFPKGTTKDFEVLYHLIKDELHNPIAKPIHDSVYDLITGSVMTILTLEDEESSLSLDEYQKIVSLAITLYEKMRDKLPELSKES